MEIKLNFKRVFDVIKFLKSKIYLFVFEYIIQDLFKLAEVIIIVVSFLMITDYFSSKPSLEITVKNPKIGYNIGSWEAYYSERNIDIPDLFSKNSLLKEFSSNRLHIKTGSPGVFLMPPEELVEDTVKNQNFDPSFIIDILESNICKLV